MIESRPLYDAEVVRTLDQQAMVHYQTTGFELMQRAAAEMLERCLQRWPSASRIQVWCGKGNNGGDAWLLAAYAQQAGCQVQAVTLHNTHGLEGDAELAWRVAEQAGVPVVDFAAQATELWQPGQIDLVIDGLLGTGCRGPLRNNYAKAIAHINHLACPVASVDVPSGLNASTGVVDDDAVRADLVVTFIAPKAGLATGAGLVHAPVVQLCPLQVEVSQLPAANQVAALEYDVQGLQLLPLDTQTYKHQQGHVLVVGGDLNMPGAVLLACEGALRGGAGMVTCLTRSEHRAALVSRTPEVMVIDTLEQLTRPDGLTAIVLGPGLGRRDWGEQLYRQVEQISAEHGIPVILDADGLFWLAESGHWQGSRLGITPHMGEAIRLLPDEQAADRFAMALGLAGAYNAMGVLKGAGSLVFRPDQVPAVCRDGNAGMASAGMGDVLAGLAGGFWADLLRQTFADDLARDQVYFERLCTAVSLHSAAADMAVKNTGQRALVATDVLHTIPGLMRALEQQATEQYKDPQI